MRSLKGKNGVIRFLCVDSDKNPKDLEALKKDMIDKVNDAVNKAILAEVDPKNPGA